MNSLYLENSTMGSLFRFLLLDGVNILWKFL